MVRFPPRRGLSSWEKKREMLGFMVGKKLASLRSKAGSLKTQSSLGNPSADLSVPGASALPRRKKKRERKKETDRMWNKQSAATHGTERDIMLRQVENNA